MNRLLLLYCSCAFFSIPWAIKAQGNTDFFINKSERISGKGLRIGASYSISTLGLPPNANFGGIKPSTAFYVGGYYFTDIIPNQLAFRVDATLQRKGLEVFDMMNKFVGSPKYYYIGLTPLIGLHLTSKLTGFIGPEINALVSKRLDFGNAYPLELGSAFRLNYRLGRMGVEISYFRAFTKYDRIESTTLSPPTLVDFFNQNWQAGLTYQLVR